MSRISGPGLTDPAPGAQNGARDIRELDMDQFLQLLIAELQNQDPLSPMENSEILQQISQIREISATNQLSDTLAAVQTGQNLSTASSLIGKTITAMDDDGKDVTGKVERVSITANEDESKRSLKIHIGDKALKLENIRNVTT